MILGFVLFGQESTVACNELVQTWTAPSCSWWRVDSRGAGTKQNTWLAKLNVAQTLGVIPFIQEQSLLSLTSWGSLLPGVHSFLGCPCTKLSHSLPPALCLRKAALDRCLLCPQTFLVLLLCLLADLPY